MKSVSLGGFFFNESPSKIPIFHLDNELSVTNYADPLLTNNDKDYLLSVASMVNSVKT